jgi:hypothetical protein
MATRRLFLHAFACVFLISLSTASSAVAQISPRSALADLNAMRASAGMPAVKKFRRTWNIGCRMHNNYMVKTGEFGHSERPSSAYYSRSGAKAARNSVISQPGGLPSQSWGGTIYHRQALLQPRLRSSGYDGSSGFACLQVISGITNSKRARTRRLTLYAWPPNGSTGHAPEFDGNEFPNPFADAPGANQLGTPITVSVNGPWSKWQLVKSKVSTTSLVADGGRPVPLSVSDRSAPNAQFLQGGFALLPRQALSPSTWYTVQVRGSVRSHARAYRFSRSWRFQTGPAVDFG